jgi:hypothetical protein
MPRGISEKNGIFVQEYSWLIIYIDDILVCSKNLQEHLKHLQKFYEVVFQHGLVLSA